MNVNRDMKFPYATHMSQLQVRLVYILQMVSSFSDLKDKILRKKRSTPAVRT